MKRARYPGWYSDPDDPTLLRHWSGRQWDSRRRHVPAWSIATEEFHLLDPSQPPSEATPDGSVHSEALPAVTTPFGSGSTRRRLALPPPSWRSPAPPPFGDRLRSGPAARPRQRWLAGPRRLASLMVVVALIALTVSGAVNGGLRRPGNSLAADTAFLRDANAACVATLGAVRPAAAPSGATHSPTTSASRAGEGAAGGGTAGVGATGAITTVAAVQAARSQLSDLSRRILQLARAPHATAYVTGWLRLWAAWGAARVRQARDTAAGTSGGASAAGASAAGASAAAASAAAQSDARQADAFANHHGLNDCTLQGVPTTTILPVP